MQQEQKKTTGKENHVSWREGSNQMLVLYEMDEPERAFRKNHGRFMEAAHLEKMKERNTLKLGLQVSRSSLPEPCVSFANIAAHIYRQREHQIQATEGKI